MRELTVRGEALKILVEVEKGKFAQGLIDDIFNRGDWEEKDRRLLNELVLGVIRQKGLIDWILNQLVKQNIEGLDSHLLNILRLGIYQKKFLKKIPDYAIVSECVDLAKSSGRKKEADFINAILRNFLRDTPKIVFPDKFKEPALNLAIKFSHPRWLVERWLKRFGLEKTELLCEFNNQVPPLTIRVNTLKTDRHTLQKKLEKEGCKIKPTEFSPEGLRLLSGANIFQHPLFYSGFFQVQDESAMLVSHLFSPKKGEFIVDLCSAPGGKTTHLANLMRDEGEILALDVKQEKLEKVKENSQRLGIKSIKTLLLRGENISSLKRNPEAILLDVPCSNLGVLRRRVEARWRIKPQKIKELKKKQLELLMESAAVLKKGGRLIYSTCTITPEENEEVVTEFVKNSKQIKIDKDCPLFLKQFQGRDGFIRLYPESFDMDKVFMAKLVKN